MLLSEKNKFGIWQYDATCNGKRFRKSTTQRDRKLVDVVLQEDLANIVKQANNIGSYLLLDDIYKTYRNTPSNSSPARDIFLLSHTLFLLLRTR